jgi:bifunctional DNase/RNase
MTPLELVGVRIEVPANTPMMLLQESGGDRRQLPNYIGHPPAT